MIGLCKIAPAAGALGFQDVEPRQPGYGEVSIRVSAAGICGTDLHIQRWVPWIRKLAKSLPVVLGHEFSGVVEAVGEGVAGIRVGDHASCESHIPCGHCYTCKMGRAHLCENTTYPGLSFNGAFAEHVVVPASIVWVNSKSLPHEHAAMMEPFGTAVQSVLAAEGVTNLNVLVLGCGPVGAMTTATARACGARSIVTTDVLPHRLQTARKLGADRVVNALEQDVIAICNDMSNGNGMDVVIETSGSGSALQQGVEALTPGGSLRLVGLSDSTTPMQFTPWVRKGLRVEGIHGRRLFETWVHSSRLIESGRVDMSQFISHRLPLAEGLRGFDMAARGEADKVMLIPG